MNDRYFLNFKKNRGFSLIEVVLALGLSALIFASLTVAFRMCFQSLTKGSSRNDVVQHGRVAMARIMTELRYGSQGLDFTAASPDYVCKFETSVLEDNDPLDQENIKYHYNDSTDFLTREVYIGAMGEGAFVIAGMGGLNYIKVKGFTVEPLKNDGSDILVGTSNPMDAIAVRVELDLEDGYGQAFRVSSTARMRNKF